MGSHQKSVKVKDPDPAPVATEAGGQESRQAELAELRRHGRGLTRRKTILAGDTSQETGASTLLGG